MSLYARSDVMAVAVPVESGGCGTTHARPVENGAPQKIWKLNCARCESFLRPPLGEPDPAWSVTESKIPETPDEETERKDREKRTQGELEAQNADAFHRLSEAVAGNSAAMNKLVELLALLGDSSTKDAPAAPKRRAPAKTGNQGA